MDVFLANYERCCVSPFEWKKFKPFFVKLSERKRLNTRNNNSLFSELEVTSSTGIVKWIFNHTRHYNNMMSVVSLGIHSTASWYSPYWVKDLVRFPILSVFFIRLTALIIHTVYHIYGPSYFKSQFNQATMTWRRETVKNPK